MRSYIIADYERRNFSVSQATSFDSLPPQQIIAITSLNSPKEITPSSSGLPKTTLVGIIVAIVLFLLILVISIFVLVRKRRKSRIAAAEEAEKERENERRVEEERQAQLAKHTSGVSELNSNTDSDATRLKYASMTSELVGSEQRHELRVVETPVELPAGADYYFKAPDGKSASELEIPGLRELESPTSGGSPGLSELSNGTFQHGVDTDRRESALSGRTSPTSLRSFSTNSGYGATSPTIGHVMGHNDASPTLGHVNLQRNDRGSGGVVGRNPRFVEEGLGVVTSNVEWAKGVNEGRRIYRDSK